MKTLYLSMILMTCSIFVIFSIQNVQAIPYLSPQDLYKQSDMVFHGQVISKQTGPGPDYDYYQVKVDTYFKNQQTSDSITVAGHKPDNKTGLVSYPQFMMGDKAIFYINKMQGTYVISPYSTKAGDACDIHAFLGPAPIQGEPLVRGVHSPLTLLDENGSGINIISTNHAVIPRYELTNNYPASRNFTVEASVQNQNDTSVAFYKKQIIELGACESTGDALKWSFVPQKSDNYDVSVSEDGKFKAGTSFQAANSNLKENLNSLSPLKQFKSGIGALDVTCKTGLQLVIKSEDLSPACVTPDTSSILVTRGWTHDNTILPKNTQHIVTPLLNDTHSGKPKTTNQNKTSSPLQLFLSIDSEYENPGGPVTIDVGLNNTGSVPLTLVKSDNWPRNDLGSGLCSNLPFGISILKGYYTEQNMSSAKSLVIYDTVPCPLPTLLKSYTFEPLSSKTTQECDSLFSCPGLTDMKAHLVIPDFMYNGQHHSFDVGKYTIVGGDEWGHVVIRHFTEAYATAYSEPLEK